MSKIILPSAVDAFVTATNAHDSEALFNAFAAEATVSDDGTIYATEAEIREWIAVHQVNPKIVISPLTFDDDRLVASVDGEFPGGPLTFAFTFATENNRITSLTIGLA